MYGTITNIKADVRRNAQNQIEHYFTFDVKVSDTIAPNDIECIYNPENSPTQIIDAIQAAGMAGVNADTPGTITNINHLRVLGAIAK